MNEMALKSTMKKKKHQFCPGLLSQSLQEDISGEQETEARLLCLFDSYLNYLKTPTKSQEKVKVKARKHRKKLKAWKTEKKKKSSLLLEKENMVLCAENMNDPVYQNYKYLGESKNNSKEPNYLGSDKREVCKMLDSSFLELFTEKRGKKAKRHHNSECSGGTQEVLRGTKEKHSFKIFKAIPMSQNTEKQFCFPLSLDPYINGKGRQKGLSQRETHRLQMPCKSEELDSMCSFRGSTTKGFQQKRKLRKDVLHGASITKMSSCASTESLLFSTPRTLETRTCDFEEELDMGDPEDNRPSQISSDPQAISSGIGSQELFITQQSPLSRQVHSRALPLHPRNNAKEAVLGRSDSNSNSYNTLQFSQVSAAKETFEDSFSLTSCSLTPSERREHFSATRECGIQTDDFFSSSAVASSFIIKKESLDCHEQPLDLSLPFRIRSGAAGAEMFHSLEGAGDGIPASPGCQLEAAIKVLDDESANCMGSQSRKSDIKCIQMYLNSSYYFKLKGDPDATISGTPLVKQRSRCDSTWNSTGKAGVGKKEKKNNGRKEKLKNA